MMSQHLPSLPNLEHLRKQAKAVLRVARHRSPLWRLADAQHAVAHGYGFDSWPALKLHVESVRPRSATSPRREGKPARLQGQTSHPLAGTWADHPSDTVLQFELS